MTDIVARLRDPAYVEKNALLCATVAADEIERLEKENGQLRGDRQCRGSAMTDIVARLRMTANCGIPDFTNSKLLDEAADEIERLCREIEGLTTHQKVRAKVIEAQDDEIERLQGLLHMHGNIVVAMATKDTEIERLRALLKECADELADQVEGQYAKTKDHPAMKRRYDRDMQPVRDARAALERKP
jgi:hypothetical protein